MQKAGALWVSSLLILFLSACASSARDPQASAQTAANQLDHMTRTADRIADDIKQRWASHEAAKGAPLVLNLPIYLGSTERAVAELTLTRFLAKGGTTAAQCPERCLELSVLDMGSLNISDEQSAALSTGDLVQVASSVNPILRSLTRSLSNNDKSKGVPALLVSVSLREQQRYVQRQHFVAPLIQPPPPAQP